jgi:ectoine hydroxylase-related dioxygenase (phytanoyl-CoA dioxygenase family)
MALTREASGIESLEGGAEAFHQAGFVVARGLLSPEEVALIRDTFMDANREGPVPGLSEMRHAVTDAYASSDPLAFYPRMMHPHKHADKPVGTVAMRYMLDRRFEAILSQLMGDRPLAVQSMFYFKPPGARGQDFHQDNFYLKVKPGTCTAAWVALDRCDQENGAMMCVPETQDMDIVCPEKADNTLYFTTEHVPIPAGKTAVLPIMEPGDVLFFNGSTIHGSGPNRSKDRFRRSFICHYVPASTREMSHWYEAYDFEGHRVGGIEVNRDGGPCGTIAAAPH